MDVEMRMPDLATTGSPIKVVRWLVEVGQAIERGQPLLEVETDKAVMEVESIVSGRLSSIAASVGDEVELGATIAAFQTEGAADRIGVPLEAHRKSFFARNREARARGQGVEGEARSSERRTIPLSVPQRVVAQRMRASKLAIPHFYLQTSANAENMIVRRETISGETIAWDAFFVKAAGKALREFERLTFRFEDDQLVSEGTDAVGLAIDLDGDLFTLAIEHAAARGPEEISREIAAGVARLRSGDPRARLSHRAAITVSNLGGSGIESFAAVINPPESAILAVGKIMPVVTVDEGRIAVQNRVNLTLSVDHRVASGKYAAEFLRAVVRELESS
jgi:pyruvate dehydrogenase E2 component (dihydrolipoamide acetyltransferase)